MSTQSENHHMTPEEFRRYGYALVDWIATYQATVESYPVLSQVKPGDIRKMLPDAPPQKGESFDEILKDVDRIVLPGITHWQSPNFFAYFPANNSGPSILGELLSAGLGVQGMLWATSPACTELETHVMDWLVDLMGLPVKFKSNGPGGGVIQDTASSAALCALLAARERATQFSTNATGCCGRLVAYASSQTHSSVEKAVGIAGIGKNNLRLVGVDGDQAIKTDELSCLIAQDRQAGLIPFFLAANVGTTSSNAMDPLPEIGHLCRRENIWMHVDGAMAGSATVCPEFRHFLDGLELADSYCFNPHKWMFTNFDCDCFFVADKATLIKTLSILPEYLRNKATESGAVIDYRDWHIQLGRRFRALKLWFVIRHYGIEGLQFHIRRHVELAQQFARWVGESAEFEVAAPAPLNLVCFRHKAGDEINKGILDTLNQSGQIFLSHTQLQGRYTLRLCVGQTHTEFRHVKHAWDLIRAAAAKFSGPIACLLIAMMLLFSVGPAFGQALPEFDFTKPETISAWHPQHDIGEFKGTSEGLSVGISGSDPYFAGPLRNYPQGQPLWMFMRIKSDQGGQGSVFYFQKNPSPEQEASFQTSPNKWTDVRILLPPMDSNYRLRIDPPGNGGNATIAKVWFEVRREYAWPKQEWLNPVAGSKRVLKSGDIELYQTPSQPAGFEVRVSGKSMASGHASWRVGYLYNNKELNWVEFGKNAKSRNRASSWITASTVKDAHGAEWTYQQTFSIGEKGSVRVETQVQASQDREVMYLPMLLLAAGELSFVKSKGQGLFAGLEYLENEPSSSEADIVGPESKRQTPSTHKITFPLMTIQAEERYLGMIWENQHEFTALFDSPDRLFGSKGHIMGLLWPESNGDNRIEGSLLPLSPKRLSAGRKLTAITRLIGSTGETIIPAVQKYVELHGLPDVPKEKFPVKSYLENAAQGWLDSQCREGSCYRHAVWPGFGAVPAADAALYQQWIKQQTEGAMATKLGEAIEQALSPVPPRDFFHSGVGHIRTPAVPLVYGHIAESMQTAKMTAQNLLSQFSADGYVRYRRDPAREDYGKTHFADHANGISGRIVASILEASAYSGDPELIRRGLEKLNTLKVYNNSVPRGAQTWEIALHTPDILASAHMVNAYALGYELTGEKKYLDRAGYWAWTGVPFVYLENPTESPVGPYSTIAVLGATSWKAPVWMGQPVQWCGLVYADALYRLSKTDRSGPWRQLADGITMAGMQHTWKADDKNRVGLLPDFYLLKPQRSDGPAINPGTLQINAMQFYNQGPLYQFKNARLMKIGIHAPGNIELRKETISSLTFHVQGWPLNKYFVLINGVDSNTRVKINGKTCNVQDLAEKDIQSGWIALDIAGNADIDISR